jgi:hypothetical protein
VASTRGYSRLNFGHSRFAAAQQPTDLSCRIGPIEKTYGGTKWNVYGCDDKKSLLAVTAADNPAMPFYFIFYAEDGGYHLSGDGTGDKKFTDATYRYLVSPRRWRLLAAKTYL